MIKLSHQPLKYMFPMFLCGKKNSNHHKNKKPHVKEVLFSFGIL